MSISCIFPDFLAKVSLHVQIFGFVILCQWRKNARPCVDLSIQPGDLVPGVRDHGLVRVRQVIGHTLVRFRGRQTVLAVGFNGQRLPHENLADSPVLPGQKVLMNRTLRLPGTLQFDIRPVRDDGHGILHHA